MTALSPGQVARDAHYAAAMWLLTTDPAAALAILRVSHDTLPPAPQCESPISRANPVHSSSINEVAA